MKNARAWTLNSLAEMGALFRRSRIRRGWSQQFLAEKAGVAVRSIRRLEAGLGSTQAGTIDLLAQALGLCWRITAAPELQKGA